jgi:hypothetical protein
MQFYESELRLTGNIFQVPVTVVFTKYDQFKRNIEMELEDQHRDRAELDVEVEKIFRQHYLAGLSGSPPFVCLESKDFEYQLACTALIFVLKKCTSMANGVLNLLKRLPVHSPAVLFPSCS